MKREEVRELFPEASDEQIDAILNKAGSEINGLRTQLKDAEDQLAATKTSLESSQADAAGYKSRLEEAQKQIEAGMSAEDLIAQREKAAEEREREFVLKSNALDAKAILVGAGCFSDEEVEELVERVTTDDAEATKKFAQSLVDMAEKQRKSAEEAARDALLKENPKLQGGASEGVPTTVEEFLKLDYKEQLALKEADPDIVKKLTK